MSHLMGASGQPENALVASPDEVISVSHVYKQYRHYTRGMNLRHEAARVVKGVLRRYGTKKPEEPFYALRDVTFSVKRGEALGIVGRNGAGKTTLLRVLSHITTPTRGSVEVRGRFATLIGLNAGFNREMSGRQNIYLNAAFFGWNPKDVRAVEKDIIDFAEIGSFIDAPTKVYSSGMEARLGFSIAIHILPEIIFLDEVLAVGDTGFAAKCTERIRGFRDEGRTIVMVAHSTDSILDMCTRAIWLRKGELVMDGATDDVVRAYTGSMNLTSDGTTKTSERR
ncbi:MAG: ABC transporter ATP-binding protein [Anaerolineae bacterium]